MEKSREPIAKKQRFEIFKRDSFKCQYCGSCPPGVVLEVDHILPVSKGGNNDDENLITSCFDCNRGKGGNMLTSIPANKIEVLQEKELQIKEYQKLLKSINRRINKEIDAVDDIYSQAFPEYSMSDNFRELSVKKFLKALGVEEVKHAMRVACMKPLNENKTLRYFCGVCYNKIRAKNGEAFY